MFLRWYKCTKKHTANRVNSWRLISVSIASVGVATSDLMFMTKCLVSDVFAHEFDVELLRLQQYIHQSIKYYVL